VTNLKQLFVILISFTLTSCGGNISLDSNTLLTPSEVSENSTLALNSYQFDLRESLNESCSKSIPLLSQIDDTSLIAESFLSLNDGSIFYLNQHIFKTASENEAKTLVQNLKSIPLDSECFSVGRSATPSIPLSQKFNTNLEGLFWTESVYSKIEVKVLNQSFTLQTDTFVVFVNKGPFIYTLKISTEPAAEITKSDFPGIIQKALDKVAS
jgi:hypothetical protein